MTASPSVPPEDRGDAEEFPEDPRFRVMRRLVTFLLMVLIAGTLTVVIALLLKLKSINFSSANPTATTIGIAADERLVRAEATSERITLLIERKATGAQRIVILDAQTFRVLSAIASEKKDAK
ncbi:MAG: DUF6476 family protein [Neomegalonema sp.]|nr:DUF6476 family protein [Neomegalonema sp.]